MKAPIHIIGAGPAGLTAGIVAAGAGIRVIVHERQAQVGHRFHGDFQGIENWTTRGDVLDELAMLGIDPSFEVAPFREAVFFDPEGRQYCCKSESPLFYLVRRGPRPGTLDDTLRRQAEALGVRIVYNDPQQHLPGGGIVAAGPQRAPAIAVGYLFDTDAADGAYAVAADSLAPKGYGYLLVHQGRGTVASCIFSDFHQEQEYLKRTVAFFRRHVGVKLVNPSRFGGHANAYLLPASRKGNMLYVGEAAGFQDALFGFGMRFAMVSGALAAGAWLDGDPGLYDRLWKPRLRGLLRVGLVNRFLFERLGDAGYTRHMPGVARNRDGRSFLRGHYAPTWWKSALFHLVRPALRKRIEAPPTMTEGCDCTFCRCARQIHGAAASPSGTGS